MHALWIEKNQVSFRDDAPPPPCPEGESRVKVITAGICSTDLALMRGYMDFSGIPGHEFVGIAMSGPHQGKRVVGEINASCQTCETCLAGKERHCPTRTVLGILDRPGCFADEISLPQKNLHLVPEDLSSDAAVFAEPLAAAFEIPEQTQVEAGMRALVLGDGRLGLLCAQVLALSGLDVTVHGRHQEREDLLPPEIRHRGLLPGKSPSLAKSYDLAVEATGAPGMLEPLLSWVRPRGKIILKTTSEARPPLDLSLAVINELEILGSRCGPFPPALAALASGAISVKPLIQARFPLEQGKKAFDRAGKKGVLKILVDVGTLSAS